MVKRNLEKEIVLTNDENSIELRSPIKLEYYLLESKITDQNELNGLDAFGVEIVKIVEGAVCETKVFQNYSCSKENTIEVINKLIRNTVTPVSLPYVLDDLLAM